MQHIAARLQLELGVSLGGVVIGNPQETEPPTYDVEQVGVAAQEFWRWWGTSKVVTTLMVFLSSYSCVVHVVTGGIYRRNPSN